MHYKELLPQVTETAFSVRKWKVANAVVLTYKLLYPKIHIFLSLSADCTVCI